jgi:RHS repeat-associated protein
MQGAGGIGGILAITQDNQTGYPFADGNGNISHIHSPTDEVLASYIYDPYGNKLSQSGPWQTQPYQWSSKEHHQASGLVYYLYRFYNPETGRWINRDPIGERGGFNLYAMVRNRPTNYFDPLGLDWSDPNRGGGAWADVDGKCGDKVEDLAKKIKLDAREYKKWLKLKNGKMPSSESASLEEDSSFEIPNTVYIDLGQPAWYETAANVVTLGAIPHLIFELRNFAKNDLASYYSSRGFRTKINEITSGSAIKAHLKSDDIYGYIYAGHGGGLGILVPGGSSSAIIAGRYTNYRIAAMVLLACSSAESDGVSEAAYGVSFNQWQRNVSADGVFIGIYRDVSRMSFTPGDIAIGGGGTGGWKGE